MELCGQLGWNCIVWSAWMELCCVVSLDGTVLCGQLGWNCIVWSAWMQLYCVVSLDGTVLCGQLGWNCTMWSGFGHQHVLRPPEGPGVGRRWTEPLQPARQRQLRQPSVHRPRHLVDLCPCKCTSLQGLQWSTRNSALTSSVDEPLSSNLTMSASTTFFFLTLTPS